MHVEHIVAEQTEGDISPLRKNTTEILATT